jgi:23S rRNA pseudouridine1911/1915/1917 synthase
MTERRLLLVPPSLDGERADAALSKMLGMSRSASAELLLAGAVLSGTELVTKSQRVTSEQVLEVSIPDKRDPLAVEPTDVADLRIVYEDADLIVVDKPAGVAAHPSVGWTGPTVVGALMAKGVRISTSGAAERQGIVQRLDVGTSGLMMVAKTEVAYSRLKQAFRDRAVHKVYHAVIQGHPDPVEGTIDAPIGRHPKAEFKFAVMNDGKPSITHYKLLEAFASASLVEVVLETGRTHQIRVHFSAFKHPLIGDTMYGADPTLASRMQSERQWLHAMRLSFLHPMTGEQVSFESHYTEDLAQTLERLKGN